MSNIPLSVQLLRLSGLSFSNCLVNGKGQTNWDLKSSACTNACMIISMNSTNKQTSYMLQISKKIQFTIQI
jgi:hypothetical protein